jgi:hypothetical protein
MKVDLSSSLSEIIGFLVSMAYSPLSRLGRFISFLILYTVGMTPWTGDQPSQGRYLHTEQHNTEGTHTDIHVWSGLRTHDPSVQVGENTSCLRPCGRCDWQII